MFREDLLFRLNVVTLLLPPLRARPADLDILLPSTSSRNTPKSNGLPPRACPPPRGRSCCAHTWRGNVRELENAMHRAVLLAKGDEIDADAITLLDRLRLCRPAPRPHRRPASPRCRPKRRPARWSARTVADVERDLILDTLYHCLGNRTHAANILGISIRTLRNKLKQYTSEGRERSAARRDRPRRAVMSGTCQPFPVPSRGKDREGCS